MGSLGVWCSLSGGVVVSGVVLWLSLVVLYGLFWVWVWSGLGLVLCVAVWLSGWLWWCAVSVSLSGSGGGVYVAGTKKRHYGVFHVSLCVIPYLFIFFGFNTIDFRPLFFGGVGVSTGVGGVFLGGVEGLLVFAIIFLVFPIGVCEAKYL